LGPRGAGIGHEVHIEELEAQVLDLSEDPAQLGLCASNQRHAICGLEFPVREGGPKRRARGTFERQQVVQVSHVSPLEMIMGASPPERITNERVTEGEADDGDESPSRM
jgi:hypothetical protein